MKDLVISLGNILLSFFDALKPTAPIIGACLGASLTIFFNYILSGRAAKRRITRNTISLLSAYLEELQIGMGIINNLHMAISADDLSNIQWSLLPNKTWENFPLDPDHLSRLWLLKDRNVDGYQHSITDLPNDLKNCFDHISTNYSVLISQTKVDAEKWLDLRFAATKAKVKRKRVGDLTEYKQGYQQTIALTRVAITRLSDENTRWPIERTLSLD